VDTLGLSDDERAERTKSGALRVDNQVHWARNYLVWDGLIDPSQRGVWKLTPAGWSLPLDAQNSVTAFETFKRIRASHAEEWGQQSPDASLDEAEEPPEAVAEVEAVEAALVSDLRSTVLSLSPTGFENLCKRLLSELGLIQLRAVGQAGDRGIDVDGLLRVNAVVSFRVGVQCKRYADLNQVTPRLIREFQGSLGPFDRGIFISTSVFTKQAVEQASSPGYKPIDLIDGERLVELLLEHQLGIKEVTVVDKEFFAPFL